MCVVIAHMSFYCVGWHIWCCSAGGCLEYLFDGVFWNAFDYQFITCYMSRPHKAKLYQYALFCTNVNQCYTQIHHPPPKPLLTNYKHYFLIHWSNCYLCDIYWFYVRVKMTSMLPTIHGDVETIFSRDNLNTPKQSRPLNCDHTTVHPLQLKESFSVGRQGKLEQHINERRNVLRAQLPLLSHWETTA